MTRKAAFAGFSYFAGLLIASFLSLWLSLTLAGMLLCLGICVFFILRPDKSGRLFRAGVCAFFCSTGLFLYSGYDVLVRVPISADDGSYISAHVTIKDVTVYSEENAFYTGECVLPCGKKGNIGFYDPNASLVRGDTVTLSGRLYTPEENTFFRRNNLFASNVFLLADVYEIEYHIKDNNPFRTASHIRKGVMTEIRRWVPSDEGEFIIGMIFGNDVWNISPKAESSLYSSGIGHIATVSGTHMSIAASAAASIAVFLGLGRPAKFTLAVTASAMFGLMAGFTVSVVRSLIMILIVYSAELLREEYDSLSALGIAIVLMTAAEPFSVRDVSFLLSVSGVMGAAVFAPELISSYEKYIKNKYRLVYYRLNGLIAAAVTAAAASLAVFPAAVLTFDEISVISPLANFLLAPLCSWAVALSVTGGVLSLLPFSALSGGIFFSAGIICKAILGISGFLGNLSFASVPTRTDVTVPLLFFSAAAVLIAAFALYDRLYTILTLAAVMLISVCTMTVYSLIPRPYPEIAVLTEGNGCIIVMSDNETTQMIDLMGTPRGISAVQSHLKRMGAPEPGMIMLTDRAYSALASYNAIYPHAQIISPDPSCGLTYMEENNIIKYGDFMIYPHKGHFVISSYDTDIICVTAASMLPEENFDLAVLDCRAGVNVGAEYYAVTDRKYGGDLPVSADISFCRSAEYIIINGRIEEKEETKWLR